MTDNSPQTPPQPSPEPRVFGLLPDGVFVSLGDGNKGRHALASNVTGVPFAQAVLASEKNQPTPVDDILVDVLGRVHLPSSSDGGQQS